MVEHFLGKVKPNFCASQPKLRSVLTRQEELFVLNPTLSFHLAVENLEGWERIELFILFIAWEDSNYFMQ